MSEKRDKFVQEKIGQMTLDEKVGQLLTFTWRGAVLTPSGIEQITKLHAGGLCLEPYGLETCRNLYWGNTQIDTSFDKPADYFDIAKTFYKPSGGTGVSVTPEELTEALNHVQKIAMDRPSGVPLHITIDFEGDFKNDYTSGGIRQFPPPMGLTAIGDTDLTYKVGLTVAKQLRAMGVTQMYSPVCDVNINPRNPEIGLRSFGDDPKVCAEHVKAIVKGYQEGGIAATAKHYPGRGDSSTDAHDVLDKCQGDLQRMKEVELVPFQAAVDAGCQAVMTAHTIFPAYDTEYPATLSKRILTGLLREEMGFTSGVITVNSAVKGLSGGEKQGVAIGRALYFNAEIIILDEPTMGLSLKETRKLLDFVRHIKDVGKSAVFIDHNIFHVYSVADRVVVLDRGRVAGEFNTADISLDDLMEKMYRVAETGSMD